MGDGTSYGYSSSSEEEHANWKAAIESVANTTTFGGKVFGSVVNGSVTHSRTAGDAEDDEDHTHNPQKLKHYQIKAQKLLDLMLEKTLVIARDLKHIPNDDVALNEDEIQRGRKRPRILPGQYVDEETKKFRRQLLSVAVDGIDIITAAKDASQKLLARLEAKEAAGKEKPKKEEERVAELKRIRGEREMAAFYGKGNEGDMSMKMQFLPEDWDESRVFP